MILSLIEGPPKGTNRRHLAWRTAAAASTAYGVLLLSFTNLVHSEACIYGPITRPTQRPPHLLLLGLRCCRSGHHCCRCHGLLALLLQKELLLHSSRAGPKP
jgi:hypothetical protein